MNKQQMKVVLGEQGIAQDTKGGSNTESIVGEEKIQKMHGEKKKAIPPLQPRKHPDDKLIHIIPNI